MCWMVIVPYLTAERKEEVRWANNNVCGVNKSSREQDHNDQENHDSDESRLTTDIVYTVMNLELSEMWGRFHTKYCFIGILLF